MEKENYQLQVKYSNCFAELFQKRSEIIQGIHEPTNDECNFITEEMQSPGFCVKIEKKDREKGANDKTAAENKEKNGEQDSGITNFWLIVIENSNLLIIFGREIRYTKDKCAILIKLIILLIRLSHKYE
ncbi:hypothetical protein B4U79_18566 [Dinothrombium tinctorium]|uniref:Uncharacterized protein n=1 Tax=Dinothrombium tinctorium TaxID=1965070 RepID=A0A3S3PHZ4_9ACAR|nr:hypothetical protein B4U79_18566 [Dinothrombium tinctorium]